MNSKRFLFDTDFSAKGDGTAPPPRVRRAVPTEEVEKLKADAYLAGTASIEAKAVQAQAMAVSKVAEAVLQMLGALDEAIETHRQDAAQLAHAIARKLAGSALDALPSRTIEDVIEKAIAFVPHEPRIVVRAHPDAVAPLKESSARLAAEHGYVGRIVIIGEAQFRTGDCRIEWADGGMERSLEAIDETIRAAFAHDAAAPDISSEG